MPSTILIFTCLTWARTTLREALNASASTCQGNGHWSADFSDTVEPVAAGGWPLSLPFVAQGPRICDCWRRYRTKSQCAPPTTPTRWPGREWPKLWRTHVNVGPKSSNPVASTEVRASAMPRLVSMRLGPLFERLNRRKLTAWFHSNPECHWLSPFGFLVVSRLAVWQKFVNEAVSASQMQNLRCLLMSVSGRVQKHRRFVHILCAWSTLDRKWDQQLCLSAASFQQLF